MRLTVLSPKFAKSREIPTKFDLTRSLILLSNESAYATLN